MAKHRTPDGQKSTAQQVKAAQEARAAQAARSKGDVTQLLPQALAGSDLPPRGAGL